MAKMLTSIKRFIGVSTEPKPTDCPNGSTFLEKDTGLMQIFEEGNWTPKDLPSMVRTEYLLKELLDEARNTNSLLEVIVHSLND